MRRECLVWGLARPCYARATGEIRWREALVVAGRAVAVQTPKVLSPQYALNSTPTPPTGLGRRWYWTEQGRAYVLGWGEFRDTAAPGSLNCFWCGSCSSTPPRCPGFAVAADLSAMQATHHGIRTGPTGGRPMPVACG